MSSCGVEPAGASDGDAPAKAVAGPSQQGHIREQPATSATSATPIDPGQLMASMVNQLTAAAAFVPGPSDTSADSSAVNDSMASGAGVNTEANPGPEMTLEQQQYQMQQQILHRMFGQTQDQTQAMQQMMQQGQQGQPPDQQPEQHPGLLAMAAQEHLPVPSASDSDATASPAASSAAVATESAAQGAKPSTTSAKAEASAAPTDAGQAQPGWGPVGYMMGPNGQMQAVPMMNPAQFMMPPQAGATGAGAAQGYPPGMMPGMPQGMMQMMVPWNMQQMMAQQAAMANGGGWNGMQGINQAESGGKSGRAGQGKKAKRPLGPGSQRKCWLCVVYGESEEDKARLQMKWSDDLGELDWADGHSDNWCPAVDGRASVTQAAAAKRAWSLARSKRSPYRRFIKPA